MIYFVISHENSKHLYIMKYNKMKLWLAALAVVLLLSTIGVVAWLLMPVSAESMRRSAVIVEQSTWQEITIDGKPQLYFSSALGDSALLGVTANRDSALHRKHLTGCWVNRWMLVPSCWGRIATVYSRGATTPNIKGDSNIVNLCRLSIAQQLKTLKTQKSELDYYLRVHGVQDNGYQTIASFASHVNMAYNDVMRASQVIDSLVSDAQKKRHKFELKSVTEYVAVYRDDEGKLMRYPLKRIFADGKRHTMLLQTEDEATPSDVATISKSPWGNKANGGLRAVGFPGLGEKGLECDTVSSIIIPGSLRDYRHDLPRVLVSDGAPVFTAKGFFIGIVSGNRIVTDLRYE